jgi:hypothetical protein
MCSTICTGRRSRRSPRRTDGGPDVACARCDGPRWVARTIPNAPGRDQTPAAAGSPESPARAPPREEPGGKAAPEAVKLARTS